MHTKDLTLWFPIVTPEQSFQSRHGMMEDVHKQSSEICPPIAQSGGYEKIIGAVNVVCEILS